MDKKTVLNGSIIAIMQLCMLRPNNDPLALGRRSSTSGVCVAPELRSLTALRNTLPIAPHHTTLPQISSKKLAISDTEKETNNNVSRTINTADTFYRATHVVLARYCYRKSSVHPSVRPSVCLAVTLMYRWHIGWASSKVIT